MLAVGLCCAKEHCELIKKVDGVGYAKFNIMCQETPGFDSVKYQIHLANHKIDLIVVTMFKREMIYEECHVVFTFEAAPESIAELERNYRITDEVIKFIVVRKDEK